MSLRDERDAALDQMAQLIDRPEKWTQGQYAKNGLGLGCAVNDPAASCWCLEGAFLRISPAGQRSVLVNAVFDALSRASGRNVLSSMISWNDAPGRTHADVLALIAKAKTVPVEDDGA